MDFDMQTNVSHETLLKVEPYFRFSTYEITENESTKKVFANTGREATWHCRTKANAIPLMKGTHFNAGETQLVVLNIEANDKTILNLKANNQRFSASITNLLNGSIGDVTAGPISPAITIHRAIPEPKFRIRYKGVHRPEGKTGVVYLRVTQGDGQIAWISPLWFE